MGIEWNFLMDIPFDDSIPEDAVFSYGNGPGELAYWYGKNHNQETIRKISEAKKGTKLTEEHKQKIRAYRHTDEARLNIKKNHAFRDGRAGHSERMSGNKNPGVVYRGKSWIKDPISGKRIWVEMAKA